MPSHDPLSDRLTVEAMATALDLHGVDPRDDTAVVQTLQRVGYRAAVIGRLMDMVEERAWHLRTLRLYVAPRMNLDGEHPIAANEGTPQQATRWQP
jgi:transposase-like protein